MFGKGLLKGLSISLKHLFGKAITQQYPEVKPKLPPRAREFFDFSLDKCTACGVCAKTCPNNVIQIESIRKDMKVN
jgi:NADH-quinone oxidoreductase subunit I